MKQPIQVVMLPTEGYGKKGQIVYNWDMDLIVLEKDAQKSNCCKPQYAYITVSQDVEPIQVGDWAMYLECATERKPFKDAEPYLVEDIDEVHWNDRKIIATTDPKLTNCNKCKLDIRNEAGHHYDGQLVKHKCTSVPQVQQSFIKEYVSNPDGEWEVEYEVNHKCTIEGVTPCLTDMKLCDVNGCETWYTIKLNQNNEVTITSVETCQHPFKRLHWVGTKVYCNKCKTTLVKPSNEKMYSREEVTILFNKLNSDFEIYSNYKTTLKDWIKENL